MIFTPPGILMTMNNWVPILDNEARYPMCQAKEKYDELIDKYKELGRKINNFINSVERHHKI